jgi:hypothetical protein
LRRFFPRPEPRRGDPNSRLNARLKAVSDATDNFYADLVIELERFQRLRYILRDAHI